MALVTSAATPLGALGVGASQAAASTPAPPYPAPYVTTSFNGSDPDAEPCTYNGQSGYCLYTSRDLNQGKAGSNYYPMTQTAGYFSTDGVSWTYEGVIFTEQSYVNKGWTPSGADHLWAPNVTRASGGLYYLLAPDVSDVNSESTSSYIGVSTSSSPFGPFTPVNKLRGNSSVNTGYASDPDAMNDPTTGREYLAYANGDGTNCGGISLGWVNYNFSGYHSSWPRSVEIDGSDVLGNCSSDPSNPHPYMEGPSLYYTPSWGLTGVPGPYLLEFAAKPPNGVVPAGCESHNQPNTDNEVIAYATADNVAGPYTYQGILMCGSTLEWTNQASIIPMRTSDNSTALIMFYHDAATAGGPPQNRTLHAECLAYGAGKLGGVERTAGTSTAATCLQSHDWWNFALMSATNGKIVTADPNYNGLLLADRTAVGPWEQFRLYLPYYGTYNIGYEVQQQAYLSGVSWSADSVSGHDVTPRARDVDLAADSPESLDFQQRFEVQFNPDGTATFFSDYLGMGVITQSSNSLRANGIGERFYVLHY